MTTLDLDALERAAKKVTSGFLKVAGVKYYELANPAAILSLISDYRALQERVEGAEKALRGLQLSSEQVIGGANPGSFLPGQLRKWSLADSAARAYFAARTKAGEPHAEQGGE